MQRYPWYADNVRELFSYIFGGLAQLARALALHARGHQFDSDILHIAPIAQLARAADL